MIIEMASAGGATAIGATFESNVAPYITSLAGPVLNTVATATHDFLTRNLSQKEQLKVSFSLAGALEAIHENLNGERELRTDGFFDVDKFGISSANEIIEGVLIKCLHEHETKKVRHIGMIFGNALFSSYRPETINMVLRVSEQLSYRQLNILAIIPDAEKEELAHLHAEQISNEISFLDWEFGELQIPGRALIRFQNKPDGSPHGFMGLSEFGEICFELLSLNLFDIDERISLYRLLKCSNLLVKPDDAKY